MIEGFEAETTDELTSDEETAILVIINTLLKAVGPKKAVKNYQLGTAIYDMTGEAIHPARIRKLINIIRSEGKIPDLVANSAGYFRAESKERLLQFANSLRQRADSILDLRQAMMENNDITEAEVEEYLAERHKEDGSHAE